MISTTGRRSPGARRARQHAALCALSAALLWAGYLVVRSEDTVFRLSMATAYASLTLLVAGLLIGPVNVLRDRPNPVSTNLRRDLGIWGGAIGLAHVVVGLQVHLRGRMIEYFVDPRPGATLPIRLDAFGLANYSGLVAGLVLVLLLALSNDLSLRRLGTTRWKNLQRVNYAGMALVLVHGAIYQLVEKRQAAFVAVFGGQLLVALVLQLAGARKVVRGR